MLRFFGNMTQSQIAAELGISQMHVSRLLARTLAQLRERPDPRRVGPLLEVAGQRRPGASARARTAGPAR